MCGATRRFKRKGLRERASSGLGRGFADCTWNGWRVAGCSVPPAPPRRSFRTEGHGAPNAGQCCSLQNLGRLYETADFGIAAFAGEGTAHQPLAPRSACSPNDAHVDFAGPFSIPILQLHYQDSPLLEFRPGYQVEARFGNVPDNSLPASRVAISKQTPGDPDPACMAHTRSAVSFIPRASAGPTGHLLRRRCQIL